MKKCIDMGVNISVSISKMQLPAPKLTEVHFNSLNLKIRNPAR